MKKNIFCILAITILFISCEKSAEVPTYNFSKESLTYAQIPLNKYFIYKDSVSGDTDSVIATRSTMGKVPISVHPNSIWPVSHYCQKFTLMLSNRSTSIIWFYGDAVAYANENDVYMFGNPSGNQKVLPKITIEGKDYSDVVQVKGGNNLSPSSPSYGASTFYWAKGIGIIKRTETKDSSTQTWTLLRRG